MIIRAGIINTPKKDFLLGPQAQADALAKLYRKHDVDVAAQPEAYTALMQALNRKRRYRVVFGRPNTVIHGEEFGTCLTINQFKYHVVDTGNLHIEWNERVNGLNMPVALLRNRLTGYKFAVIGVHVPTRNDATDDTRKRINREIREYADSLDCPVIIVGDFNDSDVDDEYRRYDVVAQYRVDQVLSRRLVEVGFKVVTEGVHNRITDHHALVIGKMKSTQFKSTLKRLPVDKR